MDCLRARPEGRGPHGRGQARCRIRWPKRYAGWSTAEAKAMLCGKRTLDEIAERVVKKKIEPQPRSGQQELSGKHRQPLRLISARFALPHRLGGRPKSRAKAREKAAAEEKPVRAAMSAMATRVSTTSRRAAPSRSRR